jgi:hypothetical protein
MYVEFVFKTYCNIFYNKLKNDEINLNNARRFINFHKFENKDTKANKSTAENILKNFIDDKLKCKNNKIQNFDYNIIINDYELKLILINLINKEYINKSYTREDFNYNLTNELYLKYINNVNFDNLNEYNKLFNNKLIPTQKKYFVDLLNKCFKFGYLIGNYYELYCDIICKQLHITKITKRVLNNNLKNNKSVCKNCNNFVENNNQVVEDDEIIEVVINTGNELPNEAFGIEDYEIINDNSIKYKNKIYKIKPDILKKFIEKQYMLYPNKNITNVDTIVSYKCKCNTIYENRKIKNIFASNECNKCKKNKKFPQNEVNDIQIINETDTREEHELTPKEIPTESSREEFFINEINNLHNQFIKNIETITKKYSLEIKKIINNYKQ